MRVPLTDLAGRVVVTGSIRLLYVALTRAMDHLVLGCYHSPPVSVRAQRTAAQQLWELLAQDDLARTESGIPEGGGAADPPASSTAPTLPSRGSFAVDRRTLLDAVRRRVATSPPSLTIATAAADGLPDETAVEPGEVIEEVEPTEAAPTRSPVRRSSSRGAAIGTATHRVLELVDLKNPEAEEVRSLVRLACAEQQIPELQVDIEGRVWSALHSDALLSALDTDARTLSEVYLVVHDGGRFLEGYIDLLVDGGPGELAVLDYKTDRATTEADIASKQEHYAPQLAAYARAVEQVTRRTPSSTGLVFARPGGSPAPKE